MDNKLVDNIKRYKELRTTDYPKAEELFSEMDSYLVTTYDINPIEASDILDALVAQSNPNNIEMFIEELIVGINIVFLDIDGVLNCSRTLEKCGPYRGVEQSKIKLLKTLIDESHARIVLISTWKEWWYKNQELKVYQDDLANYLDDCLKKEDLIIWDKIDDDFTLGRGDAIIKYLNDLTHKNIKVNNYVILDDELHDYRKTKQIEYLIKTSYDSGALKNKHINKAIRLLKNTKTTNDTK